MSWTKEDSKMLSNYLLGGLLFLIIGFMVTKPAKVGEDYELPKPDPSREALYQCLYTNEWIYKDDRLPARNSENSPRAKEVNSQKDWERDNKENLNELLEENLEGYRESTYWGEVPND